MTQILRFLLVSYLLNDNHQMYDEETQAGCHMIVHANTIGSNLVALTTRN
jgi:hypothetical protein